MTLYIVKADLQHLFQKGCLQNDNTFENLPSQGSSAEFLHQEWKCGISHDLENTFVEVKFIFIKKSIEMRKWSKVFVLQFGMPQGQLHVECQQLFLTMNQISLLSL